MSDWPTAPSATATPAVEETPEQLTKRRQTEIVTWLSTRTQLEAIKEAEGTARRTVSNTCFPTPKKGTQKLELGDGYTIKLVQTYSYKLGNKDLIDESGSKVSIRKQIEDLEDKACAISATAALIWSRLVDWKPELKPTEYLALDRNIPEQAQIGAMIDEVLEITPGMPQLEFVQPKVNN